jgi:hypothetical protein
MAGVKRSKILEQVLARARKDPEFFHNLVFNPEAVMAEVPKDRALRAAIYGLGGDELLTALLGGREQLILSTGCTATCTGDSCTSTCGARSCEGTCASSCNDTCHSSCGKTTGIVFFLERGTHEGVRMGAKRAR